MNTAVKHPKVADDLKRRTSSVAGLVAGPEWTVELLSYPSVVLGTGRATCVIITVPVHYPATCLLSSAPVKIYSKRRSKNGIGSC